MRDQPPGAEAGFFLEQTLEKNAGLDQAFENKVGPAFFDRHASPCGGFLRRGSFNNGIGIARQAYGLEFCCDIFLLAKQQRLHKAHFNSVPHSFKHMLVCGFHHSHLALVGFLHHCCFKFVKALVYHD